jgi:replicative DNA helicase
VADSDRLPPHNIEAEEAVTGSLLVDPDAILEVASFLKPDAFYREKNRWVYEACFSLYNRAEPVPINQVMVAEELARQGKLEAIGGAAYLSHLIAVLPTSIHVEHYARIVHRLALMRRLIDSAGQIAAIGYEQDPDVNNALSRAEDLLYRLRSGDSERDFEHIRPVLHRYFEDMGPGVPSPEAAGRLPHVHTGFAALDDLLGGLQRSDMVILAARPSMGKSSLALNIARNAAIGQGARVAIFSLEMSKEQLVQRLLSSEANIESSRIRMGHLSEMQQERLMHAAGRLSETAIWVDDSPLLRVMEMRSKARRLFFDKGIDLIVVDYLQLIRGDGRIESKVQEISDISRSLKALARELDAPVLALSQLSRAVESRHPHVPMLSDLRESGSIEQDADVVFFIYREELYYPNREDWERLHGDRPYPQGQANIIVAKHRNGPIGQRVLGFRQDITKFGNLDLEEVESEQPTLPRLSG